MFFIHPTSLLLHLHIMYMRPAQPNPPAEKLTFSQTPKKYKSDKSSGFESEEPVYFITGVETNFKVIFVTKLNVVVISIQ